MGTEKNPAGGPKLAAILWFVAAELSLAAMGWSAWKRARSGAAP